MIERPWTSERVREELVLAFMKPRGAMGTDGFLHVDPETGDATWNIVVAAERCLLGSEPSQKEKLTYTMLIHWATHCGRLKAGLTDVSMRDFADVKGWPWSSFMRQTHDGAEKVAKWLNAVSAGAVAVRSQTPVSA